MLSITSDYATDSGCPQPCLRNIAEAGFTHVHWCHQWCTDFVYADAEINQIAAWFKEYGLTLNDLHASEGVEKRWTSAREYERQAGVELVKNRIEMTARLGSDVIIMHIGNEPVNPEAREIFWNQLWHSLDELESCARANGIRIALENGIFAHVRRALDRYPADYIGLCYDCGHGNVSKDGLDETSQLRDRLIAVHLHDNDGTGDQHKIPFMGTVDWPRLAEILAHSAYQKPVSLEVSTRNCGIDDERAFLAQCFEAASRLAGMVNTARTV